MTQSTVPAAVAVFKYSRKRLREALSSLGISEQRSELYIEADSTLLNDRVKFYHEYLTNRSLNAKWIIIEYEYIDGDYLDDYISFYARCHQDYRRKCKRVHFFSGSDGVRLSEASLNKLLLCPDDSDEVERFRKAYLGFLVVRPLTQAVVGRTLLKPYGPSTEGKRDYPATQKYPVNLLGIELSIESLPFQEQDSVVSACATVALWSCLVHAARLFGIRAAKPAQITMTSSLPRRGRTIPSTGLLAEEVCSAIREAGLEPELFEVHAIEEKGRSFWLALIYAYLNAKLPVFLGVECFSNGETEDKHAITVAGYRIDLTNQPAKVKRSTRTKKQLVDQTEPELNLVGSNLTELYAHDDGVGPFSRLYLNPRDPEQAALLQHRAPTKKSGFDDHYIPDMIIVPVYHKIRLNFVHIVEWVEFLDQLVKEVATVPNESVEWDIKLWASGDLKRDLKTRLKHRGDIIDHLRKPLPRFVWHVRLTILSEECVELIIDATDSFSAARISDCFWHNDELRKVLTPRFIDASEDDIPEWAFFRSLLRHSRYNLECPS
ncbi:MAG: hypothetical protein WCK51_05940 [Armatimonadota bacterium]